MTLIKSLKISPTTIVLIVLMCFLFSAFSYVIYLNRPHDQQNENGPEGVELEDSSRFSHLDPSGPVQAGSAWDKPTDQGSEGQSATTATDASEEGSLNNDLMSLLGLWAFGIFAVLLTICLVIVVFCKIEIAHQKEKILVKGIVIKKMLKPYDCKQTGPCIRKPQMMRKRTVKRKNPAKKKDNTKKRSSKRSKKPWPGIIHDLNRF